MTDDQDHVCARCGTPIDYGDCCHLPALVADGVVASVPVCFHCWAIHFDGAM